MISEICIHCGEYVEDCACKMASMEKELAALRRENQEARELLDEILLHLDEINVGTYKYGFPYGEEETLERAKSFLSQSEGKGRGG